MRVFLNGDDFGLTESCSRAIAEALQRGIIHGTTMMATGEYFEQAASLARDRGFARQVGVHFNLTEGAPLTEDIRSVAAFVRDGRFHKDYLRDPQPLSQAAQAAVIAELTVQVERIRAAGFPVTRADSHHYVHNLAALAPLVAQVCRANGIVRIRLNRTFSTPARPQVTAGRIDNAWWRAQGFVTTAHFGRLSDLANADVDGDVEIMVHPDYDRNGVLIDRTGMSEGFPTGTPLTPLAIGETINFR